MRRGGLSYLAALFGIAGGIVIGLIYTWLINPIIQQNVAPWQLNAQGQANWMIMASLSYSKDHDLNRLVQRLGELRLGDKTWQKLADTACDLARTSYASTNTGLTAIRSMVEIAQSQRVSSCASTLLVLATSTPIPTATVVTATPSLIPPATKTPTPTLGPTFTPATQVIEQSPTPSGDFRLVQAASACNPKAPGLIQVTVQDTDGSPIPAVQIEVEFGDNKENFFTGLKPERGLGYADYQMAADSSYIISLPGLSSDKTPPLAASTCTATPANGGGKSLTSYNVIYKRSASR